MPMREFKGSRVPEPLWPLWFAAGPPNGSQRSGAPLSPYTAQRGFSWLVTEQLGGEEEGSSPSQALGCPDSGVTPSAPASPCMAWALSYFLCRRGDGEAGTPPAVLGQKRATLSARSYGGPLGTCWRGTKPRLAVGLLGARGVFGGQKEGLADWELECKA